MHVMVHIDLYLDNPHQASVSYPFSSIDASVDADADADIRCGQGSREHYGTWMGFGVSDF